jgi:hypothetical protein
MTSWPAGALVLLLFHQAALQPPARAAVSPQAFVGTWVGTQKWAIDTPPPGARQDQPVALTLELAGGKIIGTLTPFMGGQDGATIVDSEIIGDELRATAVMGKPRPAGDAPPGLPAGAAGNPSAAAGRGRGARGAAPANWKDGTKIQLALKNDGFAITGTADVTLNDVKWLKFTYDLSKKRSRY